MRKQTTRPTVIDLFAGAGGLSSGFSAAGFDIVGAIEMDPAAIETHKQNFPRSKTLNKDIAKLPPSEFSKRTGLSKGSIDVIIGGPPCQTFSTIGTPKLRSLLGKEALTDPRNYLFQPFLDYVRYYRPSVFLIENVPGIRTKYEGKLFKRILSAIDSLGYEATVSVLNAVEYGVPQSRKRLFIVGRLPAIRFQFPKITHASTVEQTALPLFKNSHVDGSAPERYTTVSDALEDLPIIYDGCREDELPYSKSTNLTTYQAMLRNPHNSVRNNICRVSNIRAKTLFQYMPQGAKYMDLPPDIRRILPFREDIFHDRLKRLDLTRPSWTVLAHIGMDGYMYIHPTDNRTLSVREAARLQSFDDSFIFHGNMRQQYVQVGNAVAPLVAKAIAKNIFESF